jgi:hypothetical protein
VESPDGELYAIVHPADYKKTERHGIIGTFWPMEFIDNTTEPCLYLVTIDSLGHHALMISYDPEDKNYIEVWDRNLWSDEFFPI